MIENNESIEPFVDDDELSAVMDEIKTQGQQQTLANITDIDDDDRFMDEFLKIDHNGTVKGQQQQTTPIIPIRQSVTPQQTATQHNTPSAESTIIDLLKRSRKKTWTRTIPIEIPIAQTVSFIRENFPNDVSDDRLIQLVYETISKDSLRDEILRVLKAAYNGNNKNEKNADSNNNNETAAD
jgi:hypothetical protein